MLKGVRRLNDQERELVAYLREHFAFRGAAALVRRYGWEVVSRAASDYEAAPDLEDIDRPAAFLLWLVRDLSDG